MSVSRARIEQTIKTVEGLTERYVDLTGGRITQVNEALDRYILTLEQIITLQVASIEGILIRGVTVVYRGAEFHTLRAYFQASPGLIAILTAIWTVIKIVWKIVQTIMSVVQVLTDLKVFELMASIWPAFNEARNNFRKWVSELSETLGWGVDGLLHILHATQGFTDVLGGLAGKTYTWMDAAWMEKTGNLLTNVSKYADQIGDDPGKILEILFQGEQRKSYVSFLHFGNDLTNKLWNLAKHSTEALTGLSDVADELSAIQNNMPEVIRANIPASIWSSLEGFSEIVTTQILPRIQKVENLLTIYDNVFATNSKQMGELADRLAHPGTNLLGIDDLPDYARDSELWAVDEVASRLFGEGVDKDRADMQSDLDKFDIIDKALMAPLPVLPFMDIESPQRAALYGITVDFQETWFVGGYDSQL